MELMERRRIILDTPHISLQDGVQFVTDMVAPIESLVIGFSPIQDLHGYDSPWPAGGGKNLLNASADTGSLNNINYIKNGDGTYTVNGTANGTSSFVVGSIELTANTQYVVSGCPGTGSGSSYNVRIRDANYTALGFDVGNGVTITPTETKTYYYQITVVSGYSASNLVFKPMICLSTASNPDYAHFAPYSNICPISGRTGANVSATGINIWDEEWEVGGIANGRNISETDKIRSKNYIPVVSGNTYFFYCKTGDLIFLSYYDSDKNYLSSSSGIRNVAVTMPERCRYIRFRMQTTYGTTYNHDISINYPSTDHDYHPYTGRSITINLGQTVYGGTLNVTTGVLTVDMAIVDLGTLKWIYETQGFMRASSMRSVIKAPATGTTVANIVCSGFEAVASTSIYNGSNGIGIHYNGDIRVRYDNMPTDPTAFKTAMDGVQLCYELATPRTYQLTPQQILALKGINNLSMSGQVKFWTHRDIQ